MGDTRLPRSLWELPVGDVARWYTEDVARNPLLAALIHATGGYFGGRYAAAPLTSWLADDTEEEKKERAKKFGLAGGLAGLVPSALITTGRMAKGEGLGSSLLRNFYTPPTPPKQASEKQAYFDVPTQPGTSNMVLGDPYLMPYQKAVVLQAIDNAREQSDQPLVSIGDLTRGAIQAGFGYIGAKLLGGLLGLGFGLSPVNQQRLGAAGAVANVLTSLKG